MPVFQYVAIDPKGQTVRGVVHGSSLTVVADSLSSQGLNVQELTMSSQDPEPQASDVPPVTQRSAFETDVAGRFVNIVPLPELQFFFRQLGTLLNAGINPVDAFETLSRQSKNAKLSSILLETKGHVLAGRPMSAGLQRYPEVFTPLMVSIVRAGEEGGFISEACQQVSEYIQRDVELRNMIRSETAMPKITVGLSILIILFANLVIQSIAPGGLMLPVPWMIWLIALIFGIGAFLFVRLGLPQPKVKRSFDNLTLSLPGVGGMVMGFAMAKFGRAFGALYKGGVDLPRALILSADSCGNEEIRARMYPAADRLKEGAGITETFASTGAFSPLVLDMTRTGEATGNIDDMLTRVAEYYEDDGKMKAKVAAKVVGVVCGLLVAAYVFFILITFYSAYFGRIGAAGDG
ncbi:MAG: type II secretion system F family protein [Armatimonadetes bacterium]|nr:type II secretion system F family protein [Armatimonadota bacterium]